MRAAALCLALCLAAPAQHLPGSRPLRQEGDFADLMLQGMDRWLLRELAASPARRGAMKTSPAEKRERFRRLIGVMDPRLPFQTLTVESTLAQPGLIGATAAYKIYAVRWPVLPGVDGEGLLLEPVAAPVASVVALADADQTPEQLAGIAPGVAPEAQFARRLAENGCSVLVPVLIDRQPVGLYQPSSRRPTNQTRREFINRMAFEMGGTSPATKHRRFWRASTGSPGAHHRALLA